MSDSDVDKTAELKGKIQKEIDQLLRELKAGTIDRNKLESELVEIRETVLSMPPHKH
jgi:hypothetical protein